MPYCKISGKRLIIFFKTNQYYKSLLKDYLLIESPDPVFNDSYKWSLLRMNQFIQETPVLEQA